ncbi:MAG: rod-determining factor RdfA [Halorientalis sp.]
MGCKVDALVERHDLTVPDPGYDTVDDYLVARWTGSDGRSAQGYKSLTEWFNKRLLRRLYESHDRDAVSVHLDREYDLVTGEDDLQREELAADLATDGLDIDDLADELVSWSTMRHHLKGCLDAEKEPAEATTDWERNTVRVARENAEEKTESVLSTLASKGRLADASDAEVAVQVKLGCPECSVRVPFEDALERGYVCETHAETAENAEGDRLVERIGNRSSAIAVPYLLVELLQTVAFDDPTVLDALATVPF